jgi:hypothetical protein
VLFSSLWEAQYWQRENPEVVLSAVRDDGLTNSN